MNDALPYRIFAAQRDLIERCGGIQRAADKTGYSKTEAGRWNGGANPDYMPLGAVVTLEADCGYALVTAVLAEANGRRLTDPDDERRAERDMMAAHAEKLRLGAESALAVAQSILDGVVTPSEAAIVDKRLAAEERSISEMRVALAAIKARGGDRAGLRLVGEV